MDLVSLADAILGNTAYDVIKIAIKKLFNKEDLSKEEVVYALQNHTNLVYEFYIINQNIHNHIDNNNIGRDIVIDNSVNIGNYKMSAEELIFQYNKAVEERDKNQKYAEDFYNKHSEDTAKVAGFVLAGAGFYLITNYFKDPFAGFIIGICIFLMAMMFFYQKIYTKIKIGAKRYEIFSQKVADLHREGVNRNILDPYHTIME